jgi:hypothetical protein
MGNAGRHVHVPSRPPRPTAVAHEAAIPPGRAVDGRIMLPAGQTITGTVAWRGFALNRSVKVLLTNTGGHACELLGVYPDGGDHLLRPGRTAELTVVDDCEDLSLRMRSTAGTVVTVAVPCVLARKKTVVRDATQLIEAVVETPVWMPAP